MILYYFCGYDTRQVWWGVLVFVYKRMSRMHIINIGKSYMPNGSL